LEEAIGTHPVPEVHFLGGGQGLVDLDPEDKGDVGVVVEDRFLCRRAFFDLASWNYVHVCIVATKVPQDKVPQ
jgi:hypothetical protein